MQPQEVWLEGLTWHPEATNHDIVRHYADGHCVGKDNTGGGEGRGGGREGNRRRWGREKD